MVCKVSKENDAHYKLDVHCNVEVTHVLMSNSKFRQDSVWKTVSVYEHIKVLHIESEGTHSPFQKVHVNNVYIKRW